MNYVKTEKETANNSLRFDPKGPLKVFAREADTHKRSWMIGKLAST